MHLIFTYTYNQGREYSPKSSEFSREFYYSENTDNMDTNNNTPSRNTGNYLYIYIYVYVFIYIYTYIYIYVFIYNFDFILK
jgi:hypothetical protein